MKKFLAFLAVLMWAPGVWAAAPSVAPIKGENNKGHIVTFTSTTPTGVYTIGRSFPLSLIGFELGSALAATLYGCERPQPSDQSTIDADTCDSLLVITGDSAGVIRQTHRLWYVIDVTTAETSGNSSTLTIRGTQDQISEGGSPINRAIDTDGDGDPDYVIVRGDFDGNGLIETVDIQAAMDALTDTGGKLVFVDGGGVYAAPPGLVESVGGDDLDYDKLISLQSKTTLKCSAWGEAVLEGIGIGGQDVSFSVVGGDNLGGGGNTEIHVVGCEIDGGLPDSYDSTGEDPTTTGRIGIRMHNCDDCSAVRNYVHDTPHSGIYYRESNRTRILNNLIESNGGSSNDQAASPVQRQMAIYLFIPPNGTDDVEDSVVAFNVLNNVAGGFKTRVSDGTATGRFIGGWIHSNTITAGTSDCLRFGGTDLYVASGNRCTRTDRIGLEGATAYGSFQSNSRLTITNNEMIDGTASGIVVTNFHEDITISDNTVDGTVALCAKFPSRVRGLIVSGVFKNCGTNAMEFQDGSVFANDHILQNIVIDGWNQANPFSGNNAAIVMTGGCIGQTIKDVVITGSGNWDHGIRTFAGQPFQNCVLENITIDMTPKHHIGTALFASAPFNNSTSCTDQNDGEWGIITDASSDVNVGGGGSIRNAVFCNGTTWVDWLHPNLNTHAITLGFESTATNTDSILRNITIVNAISRATGEDIDGLEFDTPGAGVWGDTIVDGITFVSTGNRVARYPLNDGLVTSDATAQPNIVRTNIQCIGQVGTCDAIP